MNRPSLLVVEADADERRRISAWLEDAGFDNVMMCPGPSAPGYTCIGGRSGDCPLSDAADVVILDLRLLSDDMMAGTPGWHLMLYYYDRGKNIVVISGEEDSVHPLPEDRLRVIHRPVNGEELIAAIKPLLPAP